MLAEPPTPLSSLFALFPTTISLHTVLVAIFSLSSLYWFIFSAVAIYHWLKYSRASKIAYPAIATHILVSIMLISYAFSALV